MAGYLTRSVKKRPEVTLKLAVSSDDMIGRRGAGQIAITGEISRRQVHMMRAQADAVLVGIGTALADDPQLTCRLPGLASRSPARIVLDPQGRLPLNSKLMRSAGEVPVLLAAAQEAGAERRKALEDAGAKLLAVEMFERRTALPELLEDLASRGISTVIVEGGAETARHFLAEDLVDRIALFSGPGAIGSDGIAAPLTPAAVPAGFRSICEARYGDDGFVEWVRAG